MTDPAFPDPQRAWAYRPASPLSGAPNGPLAGRTFSVKDLFGVPGWPLRASTRAPVPDPGESVLVRRLLDLGACAVGKTQLHEVALGMTGANGFGGTEHPFLPGHVPGGSSSGAAVSVALGKVSPLKVDFALGTDTGGSIRVPAAWCGVVGLKPGYAHPAWSTQGVLPLSVTCDHAGVLARDVPTVAQVHAALSGETVQPQSWAGVRVAVWLPQGWVDDAVYAAVQAFAEELTALGAALHSTDLPEMLDAYSPIVQSEAAQVHAGALRAAEPGFLPFTLAALRQGAALSAGEVQAARDRREAYRTHLAQIFQAADVILAPAVPTPPPRTGQDEVTLREGTQVLRRATLRLTAPFSLLGLPTLALPTATPFTGVQLVANVGQDAHLLGLALNAPTYGAVGVGA